MSRVVLDPPPDRLTGHRTPDEILMVPVPSLAKLIHHALSSNSRFKSLSHINKIPCLLRDH
jgi:hypothetical protein